MLSERHGEALWAVIAEHGGVHRFSVFRDGREIRIISAESTVIGHQTNSEARLPEEEGLDLSEVTEDTVRELWARFGLQPMCVGVAPFRVWTWPTHQANPATPKPWWQIW